MNLLLNTGNSTGLTGCHFALCMSRLSDELALSEDPVAQFTDTLIEIANQTIPKFLKTNSRKYRSLTMFVN